MLTINFNPFPVLKSESLLLRKLTVEEVEGPFELCSNPAIMKYIPRPLHKTHQDTLDFIGKIDALTVANEGLNWTITFNRNPQMIGNVGLFRIKPEHHRAEIGYMILPEHQGKGITTGAIELVLDYCFNELNMHSMEAVIDPANNAS